MGVEPKIGGFYHPNDPFVHRVFHEIFTKYILGGLESPYFWG